MNDDRLQILLEQLEQGVLSNNDSEDAMFEIMFSLLGDEGYELDHAPAIEGDFIDFIGRKPDPEDTEILGLTYTYRKDSVDSEMVQKLIGPGFVNELNRLFVVTNSRFTSSAVDVVGRNQPTNIELIDIDSLRSWVDRLEKTKDYDFAIVNLIRKTLSDKFVKLIAQNPNYLLDIEWRELERVVQVVFEELGFSSELTPGSKDGGKDVILKCKVDNRDHTYFVELKHWRSGQRVGGLAAKEFLKVIVNEEINGGLFLSTYGYCENAFDMLTSVERQRMRFGGQEKIVSLCKQYVKSQSGIWSPSTCLIDTLFSDAV
jgi:restriction system protein